MSTRVVILNAKERETTRKGTERFYHIYFFVSQPGRKIMWEGKKMKKKWEGMNLTHSGQSARRQRQRNRQQKALTDGNIGKGFLIWFLSPTSRKGTLFTCNPPGIQNDTAYGERYQIVIKRGAQNRLFVVPQRVQDFKNSFPLAPVTFVLNSFAYGIWL